MMDRPLPARGQLRSAAIQMDGWRRERFLPLPDGRPKGGWGWMGILPRQRPIESPAEGQLHMEADLFHLESCNGARYMLPKSRAVPQGN